MKRTHQARDTSRRICKSIVQCHLPHTHTHAGRSGILRKCVCVPCCFMRHSRSHAQAHWHTLALLLTQLDRCIGFFFAISVCLVAIATVSQSHERCKRVTNSVVVRHIEPFDNHQTTTAMAFFCLSSTGRRQIVRSKFLRTKMENFPKSM